MRQVSSSSTRRHGRGGVAVAALAAALALVAPVHQAGAAERERDGIRAYVPGGLLAAAEADPRATFDVIVQGAAATTSADVARAVAAAAPGQAVRRRYSAISGLATALSSRQLLALARSDRIFAITPDAPAKAASFANRQQWPYVTGLARSWSLAASGVQMPTIAIVDSGVDASRLDFGGRVVKQVTMTSLPDNSPGDGRGHGTFVASIAAGGATKYAGAAPSARIVSIDVADDRGMAMTSDVIAAADWIHANRKLYGIRVANFSLHATNPATFMYDPLDRAVQRLWFDGVVVVAAAGNYAVGGARSGVAFAPGNDPFVITVGASDIDGSVSVNDDRAAPWSAYGYTLDGFAKPELIAPGRYMIGAVPPTSTLAAERPERVVAPGYMQLSGTSFSAPAVAGAAAYLLALHPTWTPDQVKGALMLTARPLPSAAPLSAGVGELYAARAADVVAPPNPNVALNRFLVTDPLTGAVTFDAGAWSFAASMDPAWLSAAWTSAAWTSAAWTSAAWTSAAWTSAAWTSAAWTSAAWTSAAWTSISESDAAWVSNAEADPFVAGGYVMSDADLAAAELELGLPIP